MCFPRLVHMDIRSSAPFSRSLVLLARRLSSANCFGSRAAMATVDIKRAKDAERAMAEVGTVVYWARTMDWISRHELVRHLLVNKPRWGQLVLDVLGPDEHIDGRNSMVQLAGVHPLFDKPREKKSRQLTLECFGIVKRRR